VRRQRLGGRLERVRRDDQILLTAEDEPRDEIDVRPRNRVVEERRLVRSLRTEIPEARHAAVAEHLRVAFAAEVDAEIEPGVDAKRLRARVVLRAVGLDTAEPEISQRADLRDADRADRIGDVGRVRLPVDHERRVPKLDCRRIGGLVLLRPEADSVEDIARGAEQIDRRIRADRQRHQQPHQYERRVELAQPVKREAASLDG